MQITLCSPHRALTIEHSSVRCHHVARQLSLFLLCCYKQIFVIWTLYRTVAQKGLFVCVKNVEIFCWWVFVVVILSLEDECRASCIPRHSWFTATEGRRPAHATYTRSPTLRQYTKVSWSCLLLHPLSHQNQSACVVFYRYCLLFIF